MINYTNNKKGNWVITQDKYTQYDVGKTEALFTLGNGYLGLRASDEEMNAYKKSNMFINGVFNKADKTEVTELSNICDIVQTTFKIDGKEIILSEDNVTDYKKELDLKNGEVSRYIKVKFGTNTLIIKSLRFVSKKDKHLIGHNITIESQEACNLEVIIGIDGQVTNSGAQHFYEGNKRLVDNILHYSAKTYQSDINVVTNMSIEYNKEVDELILMDRRKIFKRVRTKLNANEEFEINKLSTVCSSKDFDDVVNDAMNIHKELIKNSFTEHKENNRKSWNDFWENHDVEIEGNDYVLVALRYAQFQLNVNTNTENEFTNIGAKGLTGEGYKGHAFWDTEIFMLPYFIYTNPNAAKNLVLYRYHGLEGARKKARENGYEGAMYPWESAEPSDGEVTPVWGAADIITGKPTKIESGFIEQHITSDVAYGVWLYSRVTNDLDFLKKYGFEIILDTAKFWVSRVDLKDGKYVIEEVIGPDEYKEHVNNNAFTNIMAKWNIDLALDYISQYDLTDLVEKLNINVEKLKDVSKNIKVQEINENGVIPQDDTYLTLKEIDLTKYKNQKNVGLIFEDYALSEVNKIQVSKQADVLLLFLIMEDLYTKKNKVDNFNYYEKKTLHDSSLSLSSHVVLSCDIGEFEIANNLFEKSLDIDLGQNMKTSDHGIHTASLGGMWQSVIYGFCGIRYHNDLLRIEPKITNLCKRIKFKLNYKNTILEICIIENKVNVKNIGKNIIDITHDDKILKIRPSEEVKWSYND